ncbi:oxidoreductase [Mycobacterium sp. IS-3022]|uniref:oxidoreductase n=1 Tax=Mycobacterium sp. IS-3022 TaxID=1772277 RepID=UPI000741744D|nr:oxidoreductase [Mycobacterium sp. IS-3022]KUH97261.1 short-chain dehydrogenase [Mycobacterium sp. IS-3022]KUH97422.1 short-chain dehydrogenase [Mycobacterium sp. IS-3022]
MTRTRLQVDNFRSADIPDQAGKTMVITGANNGLGLQAATALAAAGARIILACRNQMTGLEALDRVRLAGPGAEHHLVPLDLADLGSVRESAAEVVEVAPSIDVLINNAGLMAIPFARTADGFEMQIGTNHFGHFAFTDGVLPALLATSEPRVVTLSSIAHRQGLIVLADLNFELREYGRMSAYSQSKLANLLFGAELARRSDAAGLALKSVIAHPGVAATNLFDSMVPPIPGAVQLMHVALRLFTNSEESGALSQLYAATMPDVRNGDYLGPNRLFGVRGPVSRSPRSAAARNAQLAAELWEKSVELTGARYDALESVDKLEK